MHQPTEYEELSDIPSASTVHGLTPPPDASNRVSPKPNKNKPNIKNIRVFFFGFMFSGLLELQEVLGIFFISLNIENNFIK